MSQIDPLTGSIIPAPVLQRQQTADKARQLRHAQDLQKNSAAREDTFEEQVESPEELTPTHDRDPNRRQRQKSHPHPEPKPKQPDEDHLDLTA
jgi:hypothetical protein